MRKLIAMSLVGVLGASVFDSGSARAENLNLKFGPTWSCKMISAELDKLYESCRRCEKRNPPEHFNQLSPTEGECVPKGSLKGNKYEDAPPDLARERELQQKIDDLVKEREILTLKRMQEKKWRDSGVSGSGSGASRAPGADARASPSSTILDLLKAKTLTVSSYRMCTMAGQCATSDKPTTLKATEDGKWLLKDQWAHAAKEPMEPNGRFVERGALKRGEWIDTGEVSTTSGQFKLTVNERARWRDGDSSGGWDTRFVTTIEVDPAGHCQFRIEYTDTQLPERKTKTVRSENAACSIQ